MSAALEFDPRATLAANQILQEVHRFTPQQVRLVIPRRGAFYTRDLVVRVQGHPTPLTPAQYVLLGFDAALTEQVGQAVWRALVLLDPDSAAVFELDYRAVGGPDTFDATALSEQLALAQRAQASVDFKDLLQLPREFPPKEHHRHWASDWRGSEPLVRAFAGLAQALVQRDPARVHAALKRQLDAKCQQRLRLSDSELAALIAPALGALQNDTNSHALALAQRGATLSDATQHLNQALGTLTTVQGLTDAWQLRRRNGAPMLALGLHNLQRRAQARTLLDAPRAVSGLSLYLDASDAHQCAYDARLDAVVWQDQSPYRRVFVGTPGVSVVGADAQWSQRSVRFQGGHHLSHVPLVRGDQGVLWGAGHTWFYVLRSESAPSGSREVLLSNPLEQWVGASFVERRAMHAQGGDNALWGRAPVHTLHPAYPVVGAVRLHPQDAAQHAVLGFGSRADGYSAALSTTTPALEHMYRMTRIGGTDMAGAVYRLAALLVYERPLSQAEMDAVRLFLQLKYGASNSEVVCPTFNLGFSTFESAYAPRNAASLERGVMFVSSADHNSVMGDNPTAAGGAVHADPSVPSRVNVLYVRGSAQVNGPFWAQTRTLVPDCSYVLQVKAVWGAQRPPIFRCLVNDEQVGVDTAVSASPSQGTLQFRFHTTAAQNRLQLRDLRQSETGDTFGVTKIELIREPVCLQPEAAALVL